MIDLLIDYIGSRETGRFRATFHNAIHGFPMGDLTDLLDSIAVTAGIHPVCLGVEAEEDGKVFVGADLQLTVYHVVNYFKAADRFNKAGNHWSKKTNEYIRKQTLESGAQIPALVTAIETRKLSNLRAVIVTEHPNLATRLTYLDHNLRDVIIVMVSRLIMNRTGTEQCRPVVIRLRRPANSSACSGVGTLTSSSFTLMILTSRALTYLRYLNTAVVELLGHPVNEIDEQLWRSMVSLKVLEKEPLLLRQLEEVVADNRGVSLRSCER